MFEAFSIHTEVRNISAGTYSAGNGFKRLFG